MRNFSPQQLTLTLVLLRDGDRILLGQKKRGFGRGKWNGFGGKVEAGETIEEASRREFFEETGAEVGALTAAGNLSFTFANGLPELEVHVFSAASFTGEIEESEEMIPRWFNVDSLPYEKMWADDQYWLPLFLAGKRFAGSFYYADEKIILHQSVLAIAGCPVCGGIQPCFHSLKDPKSAKKRIAKTKALH